MGIALAESWADPGTGWEIYFEVGEGALLRRPMGPPSLKTCNLSYPFFGAPVSFLSELGRLSASGPHLGAISLGSGIDPTSEVQRQPMGGLTVSHFWVTAMEMELFRGRGSVQRATLECGGPCRPAGPLDAQVSLSTGWGLGISL